MRRKLTVVAIALAAIGSGGRATRVWADPGNDPNTEACVGRVVTVLASDGGRDPMMKVWMKNVLITTYVRPACAAGEPIETIVQQVREATESQ